MHHKSYSALEPQRRSRWKKKALFSPSKIVFIVSRVDWCARIWLNVRISLLEKDPATGSTLRSHEQSMEYKDATITFSRRCNYAELIQS